MAEHEGPNPFGRSEGVQNLERMGTGLLGIGIIVMMVAVPVLTVILLIYLLIAH